MAVRRELADLLGVYKRSVLRIVVTLALLIVAACIVIVMPYWLKRFAPRCCRSLATGHSRTIGALPIAPLA